MPANVGEAGQLAQKSSQTWNRRFLQANNQTILMEKGGGER